MNIRRIGIAGAGTMGSSMAQIFARYGYEVVIYNHRETKLSVAKAKIADGLATLVEAGELTRESGEMILSAIGYTTDLDALSEVDLIMENIAENMEIKKNFYRELSRVVGRETIIATNTSGLSISELATAVECPERFLGMHWFNPPHLIPLIEIIKSHHTRKEVAEAIYQLAVDIHKKPAMIEKDVPSFAANRLQMALVREALAMVQDGVLTAENVDAVIRYGLGFRWACLGPLETMDFGGLDIFYHISEYLMQDLCDSHEVPPMLQAKFDEGHLGLKSGQGFYSYQGDLAATKTRERDERLLAVYNALYK